MKFLASGKVDHLTGRVFGINDDMDHLQTHGDEIVHEGRMTLRFVE